MPDHFMFCNKRVVAKNTTTTPAHHLTRHHLPPHNIISHDIALSTYNSTNHTTSYSTNPTAPAPHSIAQNTTVHRQSPSDTVRHATLHLGSGTRHTNTNKQTQKEEKKNAQFQLRSDAQGRYTKKRRQHQLAVDAYCSQLTWGSFSDHSQ